VGVLDALAVAFPGVDSQLTLAGLGQIVLDCLYDEDDAVTISGNGEPVVTEIYPPRGGQAMLRVCPKDAPDQFLRIDAIGKYQRKGTDILRGCEMAEDGTVAARFELQLAACIRRDGSICDTGCRRKHNHGSDTKAFSYQDKRTGIEIDREFLHCPARLGPLLMRLECVKRLPIPRMQIDQRFSLTDDKHLDFAYNCDSKIYLPCGEFRAMLDTGGITFHEGRLRVKSLPVPILTKHVASLELEEESRRLRAEVVLPAIYKRNKKTGAVECTDGEFRAQTDYRFKTREQMGQFLFELAWRCGLQEQWSER
jgi:hypothetical protein